MPEVSKYGNTIYRTQAQVQNPPVDRGQQLGNVMRDYTSEQKYEDPPSQKTEAIC